VACALLVCATLACDAPPPAALVVDIDPFLYNGPAPVAVPIRVVDREGSTLEVPLAITSDAPDVASVEGNALTCLREGDAVLSAAVGTLNASLTVRCRPIVSFAPPFWSLDLLEGGPALPLPVQAFAEGGAVVTDLRFSAVSEDTSVVTVVGGDLVPRRMGTSRITLDFGGIGTSYSVEVAAPVLRDTVRLAGGEYRSWRLGPGRYRAEYGVAEGAPAAIIWRSVAANCSRDTRSDAILHCVVADSGSIVAFAQRATRAYIRVDRRPR
jgi:hypothetical protein